MKPYPIFLIGLENRKCIIIGGGMEAFYKVKGLLDVDANITVISPTLNKKLTQWANIGKFTWIARSYVAGDLQGAFLVIAERDSAERNAAIFAEAEAERAIVNVMDAVEHCNFVAGS